MKPSMVVIYVKITTGSILAFHKQKLKSSCYNYKDKGKLRIGSDATTGGKQNPELYGRRILLI